MRYFICFNRYDNFYHIYECEKIANGSMDTNDIRANEEFPLCDKKEILRIVSGRINLDNNLIKIDNTGVLNYFNNQNVLDIIKNKPICLACINKILKLYPNNTEFKKNNNFNINN